MRRTSFLASGALLVLALCACGSSSTNARPTPTATTVRSSSASSVGETSAPSDGIRAASCADTTGDGGPADITKVELAEDGASLRAAFTLAAPLNTSTGTAQLSLLVSSQDGNTAKQLGAKWIGGTVRVFVFDSGTAHNEYVDLPPTVRRSTVTMVFPSSATEDLGPTWRWGATTSVDGTDVDTCPEPGDDVLNPHQQTFPG